MSQLEFADEVLERIRERQGPYDERAYLFVLASLEHLQRSLPVRRHVSGEELAVACRDFALAQYGLLSRTVLEHWGIRSTADIGKIVFTLIGVGLLKAQDSDRPEDFEGVFAFAEAFESGYPWSAWKEAERGR
ncbi:MAG TPA: Minf_1886 family protein [Gemmatimonadales bacterium]|nr:Minf_1886 family protein [Gemmatimonadales bacterium]